MQAKYPKMQLVDIRYGLGKPTESFGMAEDLINKFRGQLDAIVAPTVVALPKVAEAVEQTGLTGKLVVSGLSTPNDMKEFVKRGTVKTVVLWNPIDLGYLAVYVAQASLAGSLKDNATQAKVPAGRLGTRDAVASLEGITAKGPLTLKNVIVLGNPFRFTKDNIDQFNLLSRERRETMQGGRKGQEEKWTPSPPSRLPPADLGFFVSPTRARQSAQPPGPLSG